MHVRTHGDRTGDMTHYPFVRGIQIKRAGGTQVLAHE
jgi:hypothetical protein